MTDPTPPNEEHLAPPVGGILPYRPGSADVPTLHKRIGEAIGGAMLAALVVFALVALWMLANLHIGAVGAAPPLVWKGPAVASGIALGILTAVTLYARNRFGKRAFALGVLIGIGVAALIEGACFAGAFK